MDALALAKRRASRRRRDEGAVMFIVAMTLVVLASVGVYALAAASTEMRTSGNERQNTQTHYLATYGVLGTAHAMVDRAVTYVKLMLDPSNAELCPLSLPGVTQVTDVVKKGGCRRIGSAELGSTWATKPTVPYVDPQQIPFRQDPGSLGPTPMNADFYVEVAAALPSNKAPGYSGDSCFCQLTVTSMGITQPIWAADSDSTGKFGGEGLETQRARVVAGPFTPCICQ